MKRGVEGEPGCLPMEEVVPHLILQCTTFFLLLSAIFLNGELMVAS